MTTPRSSSPLNPHASSSSPMTSPTPHFDSLPSQNGSRDQLSSGYASFSALSPISGSSRTASSSTALQTPTRPSRDASGSSSTRYSSQRSKRYSLPSSSTTDLFSEATTPTESLMWRERFSRRAEERERRKRVRNDDLDKRRGVSSDGLTPEEEEEADRQAQADDEEIFRRLVILQRNKAHRATLLSHEREVGDEMSDLDLPNFWEEEGDRSDQQHYAHNSPAQTQIPFQQPRQKYGQLQISDESCYRDQTQGQVDDETEQERWAREADEAEQAEREQEAAQVEKAYDPRYGAAEPQRHVQGGNIPHHQTAHRLNSTDLDNGVDVDMDLEMDVGSGVDWEAFDAMDIE